MMTFFNVQLMTPQGEVSFQCPDDEYILDAAEQAGIDMSYSCRAGKIFLLTPFVCLVLVLAAGRFVHPANEMLACT